MPGKKVFILMFAAIPVISALGIMIGNPAAETPYERFGTSIEFDYEKWAIHYKTGPDYKIDSQRFLIEPSLGVFRYVQLSGLIGMADLNSPSISRVVTDFDGSQELAFGLGIKTHFAIFYPGIGCRSGGCYPIKLFAVANWLTTKSMDHVVFGSGVLNYEDAYRFQQFDIAFYGSHPVGRTIPYLGVKWTYILGRKYRRAYSGESTEPFAKISGMFNDPGQYPKPVIGLDINIGKGYVLTLEGCYFGKSETSIGVGLSQLYVPLRDEDKEEQTVQNPD